MDCMLHVPIHLDFFEWEMYQVLPSDLVGTTSDLLSDLQWAITPRNGLIKINSCCYFTPISVDFFHPILLINDRSAQVAHQLVGLPSLPTLNGTGIITYMKTIEINQM